MNNKKKYTVGLLVSGIMDNFTVSVSKGIINAARTLDIELIIFPGKYLDREFTERKEIFYEYQYNLVFSYAQKEHLDALLISPNTIGCFTTHKRMQDMLQQYEGIPCLLLSSSIEGYINVGFDNKSGIKEAINYLVQQLKRTKIGMIGGPDNNSDAFERKKVFFQALQDNGLSLPSHRYMEGDLSRYSLNTFRAFLDQNPDLEAVFCVNDDTAIGLYDVLAERNMTAGTHLLVFGYDNIPYTTNMKPPLASVWADPIMLGETATHMIYQLLQGKSVSSKVLPTRFINRASLGFHKKDFTQNTTNPFCDNYIETVFEDIFYRYSTIQNKNEYQVVRSSFKEFMNLLLSYYKYSDSDPKLLQQILYYANILLNHNTLDYIDIERFIEHIEKINVATGYTRTNISSALYQKLIPAMKQQYGNMLEMQEAQKYALLLFVKDTMSFETGDDESYATPLKHLNWLHINNASIYIYEKPIFHPQSQPFTLPDTLYIKAFLRNGIAESIPADKQLIHSSELFTNPYTNHDLPQVLFPLYSNETIYGLMICDMSDKLYDHGDFLVNQISAAMKMIFLLKSNDRIQQQLENSLNTLKKSNIALEHMSKYDVLTGILNRRGFFDTAEIQLQRNLEQHVDTLVAYIDMNNLKLINDQFGHDEGDFSIKKIGEILKEVTAQHGIAGRIGGDEFALLMPLSTQSDIISDIHERFLAFNNTKSKPYHVTVSIGTCRIYANQAISLSAALAQADIMLYEEKRKRKAQSSKI